MTAAGVANVSDWYATETYISTEINSVSHRVLQTKLEASIGFSAANAKTPSHMPHAGILSTSALEVICTDNTALGSQNHKGTLLNARPVRRACHTCSVADMFIIRCSFSEIQGIPDAPPLQDEIKICRLLGFVSIRC